MVSQKVENAVIARSAAKDLGFRLRANSVESSFRPDRLLSQPPPQKCNLHIMADMNDLPVFNHIILAFQP
jgi:hypothetical protein